VNKQFTLWATAMVLATSILIGIGLAPIVQQRVYSVHEDTGNDEAMFK
jgi:hypothetical protein